MKKILQILTVIAVCFSFTTYVFADSTHEITKNESHIVLTPNQANDELTVTLHLSKEMYDRQIATFNLSLQTSKSLENSQKAFTLDKTLTKNASISDVHYDSQAMNIVLSNTTKLFDEQVVTLGSLRIEDMDKLSELTVTPQKMSYVYVGSNVENTMSFDCPAVTLTIHSNGNDDNNNGGNSGNQDSNNNGGNSGNQDSNNNSGNNGNQDSNNNGGNNNNQDSSTSNVIIETSVTQTDGQNVQLSDETQTTIKDSTMNFLKKNYADALNQLPNGSVVKTQVSLKPLSESDLTDEQKQKIAKVLEDGANVLTYYDITITATAYNADGNILPEINGVTITQMDKAIQLSLTIPSQYIKDNRKFGIIRLHDNKATGLSSTVKDNVITFETDCFSIYALAAKDYTQAEVNKNPELLKKSIVKVNTSDNTSVMIPMIALGVSLLIIAGIVITRKRKTQ